MSVVSLFMHQVYPASLLQAKWKAPPKRPPCSTHHTVPSEKENTPGHAQKRHARHEAFGDEPPDTKTILSGGVTRDNEGPPSSMCGHRMQTLD